MLDMPTSSLVLKNCYLPLIFQGHPSSLLNQGAHLNSEISHNYTWLTAVTGLLKDVHILQMCLELVADWSVL